MQRHDAEDMCVLVFADGFEDRFWYINLPEQIYLNGQKHHYQVGMNWEEDGDGWLYERCPVRNLFGCWDQSGPKVILKENSKSRPVIGYQGTSIRSDDNGIHYEVCVTNDSDIPWQDVYTWICFNSFQSPDTGYRPYVKLNDRWTPFQDIPNVCQHSYLPANGMTAEYARTEIKSNQLARTLLSFPGVAAWNIVKDSPLLTCHYSTDAVSAGSN